MVPKEKDVVQIMHNVFWGGWGRELLVCGGFFIILELGRFLGVQLEIIIITVLNDCCGIKIHGRFFAAKASVINCLVI